MLDRSLLRFLVALAIATLLAACGGSRETSGSAPLADASDVVEVRSQAGSTPFVGFVDFQGDSIAQVKTIRYSVEPKQGSSVKPVDVTYEMGALQRKGYSVVGSSRLTLPVFGLYANHTNRLNVRFQFADLSVQSVSVSMTSSRYVDPDSRYGSPVVSRSRDSARSLGFNYFLLKPGIGGPVVMDTDGEIRWVGLGPTNSFSTAFLNDAVWVGDSTTTQFWRLEFDGSSTRSSLISPTYTGFHHEISQGKVGMLFEMDSSIGGIANLESTLAEVSPAGVVIKEWDFAQLLSDYMRSMGDDPSAFVRPGSDWFHMNSAIYDARDDSLLVSSRENFIVKVDYQSGRILWIFGDPTKHWHSFPSLRAKALTLAGGGLYPVGQHALTISPDGLLVVFNNGAASFAFNHPSGVPLGEQRTYSAVSAYSLDSANGSAREMWRFENGQSILSDICSSAYFAADGSMLVTYSSADNRTTLRMLGLDAARDVVFDFQFPSRLPCYAAWNASPINFENMTIR
jgi:arylsulfate sulfotransferase